MVLHLSWRALLILAAGLPGIVLAQTHFTPYADAVYEYNSNYFALASGQPEPLGSSGPTLAVGGERYKAGFETEYDWSQQQFIANAEGRRLEYQDFGALDHDEYLLHAGLHWKLASVLDGVLDFRRERTQVSYLLFNATPTSYSQLFLQVQDLATASINLQFLPEWRLENQGKLNDLDSPRPGYPDLAVREVSIDEGIKYVGFSHVSAGLAGEFLDGRYTSGEFLVSPNYHQTSVDLAADYNFAEDYTISALSVFHGAIGYTSRDQEQAGTISGITGVIFYERALTGKTSVDVKLSRAINDYVSGAAPEVDTTAEIDAVWNATSKIGVTAGYAYTHSDISGTNVVNVLAPSRVDHLQTPSLSVRYQMLDWLSLKPYMNWTIRHSSDPLYTFGNNTYGIQVEARLAAPEPLALYRPGLSLQ